MISRLDLDGVGSPLAIAARIHQLEPSLPPAIPVEELCRSLDILSIKDLQTNGFEAALVMDVNKASGGILVAAGRSRKRRRYSIAHELGHFLIPTHRPDSSDEFSCSLADLHALDTKEQDRRKRIEAEANRFAAALLMPAPRIRAALTSRAPNLGEIVRLANAFDVSKEAMARAYVDAQREAIAVLILQHSRISRIYRHREMPWINVSPGRPVPAQSICSDHRLSPGSMSEAEECDPELGIGERNVRRVELLTEQVLAQEQGFAMLLLHAELADEDEGDRP